MNLSIVNTVNENVWNEFLAQHPHSNIFHTPEMLQVWNQVKGCSPKLWAAVDAQNQVLAMVTPVEVTLIGGPLHWLTTRSIAYGSVLYKSDPAGKEALRDLLKAYFKGSARNTLFTELRNFTDLSDIQPVLRECGFVYEDYLDFLINLNLPANQIFENIGSRTRKNIRRALRKNNVAVETITDRSQLPTWYSIVSKTYRAARIPLADFSLFEAAYNILQPRGMITFWLAKVGEAYVAASVELGFKETLYGWYSGVDRAYASEYPSEVLMWRILEWGAQKGYKIYDFGGAGKPDEPYGVRDFKAKFGGKLVCYGRNTYVHQPGVLWLSKNGYQAVRNLFQGRFLKPSSQFVQSDEIKGE